MSAANQLPAGFPSVQSANQQDAQWYQNFLSAWTTWGARDVPHERADWIRIASQLETQSTTHKIYNHQIGKTTEDITWGHITAAVTNPRWTRSTLEKSTFGKRAQGAFPRSTIFKGQWNMDGPTILNPIMPDQQGQSSTASNAPTPTPSQSQDQPGQSSTTSNVVAPTAGGAQPEGQAATSNDSAGKIKTLKAENSELKSENNGLKDQVGQKDDKIKLLTDKIELLEDRMARWRAKCKILGERNEYVKEGWDKDKRRNRDDHNKAEDLAKRYNDLNQENNNLNQENNNLADLLNKTRRVQDTLVCFVVHAGHKTRDEIDMMYQKEGLPTPKWKPEAGKESQSADQAPIDNAQKND
ncbi:hypothetical protein ACHAPJ_009940 [Fusarium lateritium]